MLKNGQQEQTNKENAKVTTQAMCFKHNLQYTFIQPSENKLLCQTCKEELLAEQKVNTPILSFMQAQELIIKENKQLVQQLEAQFDLCQKQTLPKMNYDIKSGLQIINNAEEALLKEIISYFDNLRQNYEIMSLNYPCQENQEYLANSIKTTLLKVQEYSKEKLSGEQFLEYFNSYYQDKVTGYKQILQQYTEKAPNKKQAPEVFVDKSCLNNLNQILSNYVQTCVSTAKSLPIEQLNFSHQQSDQSIIAVFHPPNLITYDVISQKTENHMQNENHFPQQSSLLVTPTNHIYISGGVYEDGVLANAFFKADEKKILEEKQNMIVKRAGHSMCFLNKEIYVIGGVTNNKCQTRLCEKYSETSQQWTRIAKLNYSRSRTSLITESTTNKIYAFFGFTNNQTINSIESYDSTKNVWSLIQIKNSFPWQATGAGAACQINETEILIFGGFSETNQQIIFQNNLLIYNIEANSIFKCNKQTPVDYINYNSSSVIIKNDTILAIGGLLDNKQNDISQIQNANYLLSIDKEMNPKIQKLFYSEMQSQQQQKNQIPTINVTNIDDVPKPAEISSIQQNQHDQQSNKKSNQSSPEKKN